MNKMKKILLGFSILGLSLLTGCAAPNNLSMTTAAPFEGTLVRGFIPFLAYSEEDQADSADASRSVEAEDLPWYDSKYDGFAAMFYFTDRTAHNYVQNNWIEIPSLAPALGGQPGDLVEYHTSYMKFLWEDMSVLSAVRIVCKFYDNECIDRERRDRFCNNGVMIPDSRHDDIEFKQAGFKCGGFGENSEKYAAIVGPVSELYGSLDNYFDEHNSAYRDCLVTDMSCGHDEGKTVETGKYNEFLERFPNYLAAQDAAHDYMELRLHLEGDTPFKKWAIYLSEHMFDREPVQMTAIDFKVERVNNCSIQDSGLCILSYSRTD